MRKIGAAAATAAMTLALAAFSGVAYGDGGDHGGGHHADKAAKAQDVADHHGDQSKPAKPESASPTQDNQQGNSQEPAAKVFICHATGSATNPYVLIHVSSHALKAHTSHQDGRDIVLGASAGTCPGASTQSQSQPPPEASVQMVTFCDMETATTGELETKPADKVVSHELDGKPEEARDIVPTFTFNGQTYSQNFDANGQAIVAANCNAAAPAPPAQTSVQLVTFCDMETPTTGKLETKSADKVVSHELDGKPEEARDIVPTFTFNGQTYSQNFDANGQAIVAANCNAPQAQVAGATESCTDNDQGDQQDQDVAKQHDDNGKGDDKNGEDRDQHVAKDEQAKGDDEQAKAEDNDNDENCVASSTSNTSNSSASVQSNAQTQAPAAAQPVQSSQSSTAAPAAPAASPSSGVLGATKALKPAGTAPVLRTAKPSAGVLGAVARISRAATSGTLPFSGLRLWIVELIALGLIGLGLATRLIARKSS